MEDNDGKRASVVLLIYGTWVPTAGLHCIQAARAGPGQGRRVPGAFQRNVRRSFYAMTRRGAAGVGNCCHTNSTIVAPIPPANLSDGNSSVKKIKFRLVLWTSCVQTGHSIESRATGGGELRCGTAQPQALGRQPRLALKNNRRPWAIMAC